MKKILWMVAVAMMTATSVNAQEGYDDTKHEVAISVGGASNSQWIDFLENITTTMFKGKYDEKKYIGSFSAEYFYRVKNWLGVGGIVAYGVSTQDLLTYDDEVKCGEHKNNYFTVMPAAKFDWLRKKNFGMYSKLAVGATFRSEKLTYDDGKGDTSESALHINWQASLLGFEAGSPTIRGFVEFGMGEQGVALIGLRYKF